MAEIVKAPGHWIAYEGVVEADQRDRTTTPGARMVVGSHSAQLQLRLFYFLCFIYS
jgi:hypothetical protein